MLEFNQRQLFWEVTQDIHLTAILHTIQLQLQAHNSVLLNFADLMANGRFILHAVMICTLAKHMDLNKMSLLLDIVLQIM